MKRSRLRRNGRILGGGLVVAKDRDSQRMTVVNCVSGLHSPHEGLAGGSGQSMSGLAYYQPEHPASSGVVKYPENGHDTLSDFVTFVCQEAENTQQLPQVASGSFLKPPHCIVLREDLLHLFPLNCDDEELFF